ncbi:MAG: hypothetical protein HZA90_08045 [Verrucomicrobia bacterium]|nr:hypothetical protein [Verrucomicrobiota bacterium]
MKRTFFPVLAAALPLALFLSGCADPCKKGKPVPAYYPIQVSLSPALQGKSVEVDLVGVNEASRSRYEAYSMTKYWKDGDALRSSAPKKTVNFTGGSALTASLPLNDPVWTPWKAQAISYVFVLVNLPGAHTDQPGSGDPRRQILALDKCAWPPGTKELRVVLTEGGPQVTPFNGK